MSINPKLQQGTISNDGTNVRAVLQADSHFFLETGGFSQTAAHGFGSLSAAKFRTTSKVTFVGSKKIYAVCKGQLFVQPQTGSTTKVNLILRPYTQPINEIPIKYFIYRGVNYSDLFTTGANPVIAGSETTGTEFNKFLWTHFNNFYNLDAPSGVTPPSFTPDLIGYPISGTSQVLTDKIDDYFFKKTVYTDATNTVEATSSSFELPIVPRGMELGSATGEIGIDVVLNSGDYYNLNDINPFQFDLAFARANDHELDIVNGSTAFEEKLIKESATNFIDIATFYGLHANEHSKLYKDDQTTALTAISDIYAELSGFYTKNKQYIYIKSDRSRSYAFYDNYVHSDPANLNNIALGISSGALTESTFGTNGWPIHVIDNHSSLSLQLITDKNSNACLYAKTGFLTSDHKNNFVFGEDLLQANDSSSVITDFNYTIPIDFEFQTDGGAAITSILELVYEGKKLFAADFNTPTDTFLVKDIDNVFGLIDAMPYIKPNSSDDLLTIVENDIHLINFPSVSPAKTFATVKTKRIEDKLERPDLSFLNRVTYETLLNSMEYSASKYYNTSSSVFDSFSNKSKGVDPDKKEYYFPQLPYYFSQIVFTDNVDSITGLILSNTEGSTGSKLILGLTIEEKTDLESLISVNNLTNVKMFFEPLFDYGNKLISSENVAYKKWALKVIAESNTGNLQVFTPSLNINIFSLDDFAFFSKDYGLYLPEDNENNFVEIYKPELS